jgi:hypothetical protein
VVEFAGVFVGALLGSVFGWLLQVRESNRQAVIQINQDSIRHLGLEVEDLLDNAVDAARAEYAPLRRRAQTIDSRYLSSLPESTPGERVATGKLRADLIAAMDELRAARTDDERFEVYDRAVADLNRSLNLLHREALSATNINWRSLFRTWS